MGDKEEIIKDIIITLVEAGIYTDLDAINKFLHCIQETGVLGDILADLKYKGA